MHGRVQYPETIEPLVQFIEQTPPGEILDRTLEKLRAGVAPNTMLTASALAVVRSADLPPATTVARCTRSPACTPSPIWSGGWTARTASCRSSSTSRCPTSTSTTRSPRRSACLSSRRWIRPAPTPAGRPTSPMTAPARPSPRKASRPPRRPSSRPAVAARATRPTTSSCGSGTTSRRSRRSTC